MNNGVLMEMTLDEVRGFRPQTAVLGIGSVEPHGNALPYGTDAYLAERIAREAVLTANGDGARALMLPTLPIGNNVNFKAFPFACRIGVETLMHMLLDIFAALEEDGIRKIVVVNTHGGNPDALRATLRAHMDRTPPERRAFVCMPMLSAPTGLIRHASDHAGEEEASAMLHVRGDLVRHAALGVCPFGEIAVEALKAPDMFFVRRWDAYVPLSAGGDAREATAEKGRALLDAHVRRVADLLVELGRSPWHERFPYTAVEKHQEKEV